MGSSRRLTLRQVVSRTGRVPTAQGFAPIKVVVIDAELPSRVDLSDVTSSRCYGSAWALVRLHGRPLGELTLTSSDLVETGAVERAIRQHWGTLIDSHLQSHRSALNAAGDVPVDGWESCLDSTLSMRPTVSVVVPTCRRPSEVLRCVESLLATGYPRLEVIVVDNAPGDLATATAVDDRYGREPKVRYVREPTPGASRARNRGVAVAGGEVIAFVDDDIVVDRLWVAALVEALERHPSVDCVTGLVVPEALNSPVQFWFEQFGGFNRGYVRRRYDISTNRGDTLLYPYTAGALGGLGNAAFRRSALQGPAAFEVTLGPGTPAFGAEDQDAFVALLTSGGQLLYEPTALVWHTHRDSYGELRWQVFTYGAGMVAGLTHWACRDRRVARELLRRIVLALPRILRGGNRTTALQSVSEECPRSLRRLERLGHLYGPIAYLRAVLERRRQEQGSPFTEALDRV
jgi:GT2 family glycosyltransferase